MRMCPYGGEDPKGLRPPAARTSTVAGQGCQPKVMVLKGVTLKPDGLGDPQVQSRADPEPTTLGRQRSRRAIKQRGG